MAHRCVFRRVLSRGLPAELMGLCFPAVTFGNLCGSLFFATVLVKCASCGDGLGVALRRLIAVV